MIKLNKLNKFYNKGKSNQIHVINNTSLELPNKGLISFLGASGSGKTTLLNVIGGLDKASGSISIEDKLFKNYKRMDSYRRKNIGYVFQNYNLLGNLTVEENLLVSLDLLGIENNESTQATIDYVLESLNMKKYKKRLASALSGGQQQRVSIARALVKNPEIIIADEPTGNLDSSNTIEVMNILKKISQNKLVLLVTHDKKIAKFYSDRIIYVKDGSVIGDVCNEESQESSITLSQRNNNTIYLKDLDKKEDNTENINLDIYNDGDELNNSINLNLIVVYKNGKVYVSSKNPNVRFIDDSSTIKILDEHYVDLSKEDVSNYEFKLDSLSEKNYAKKSFKSKLLDFFGRLKIAFSNFINVRRRTKFLYLAFFLVGCLIGLNIFMLSFTVTVNMDNFNYDTNTYSVNNAVTTKNKNKLINTYNEAIDRNLIADIHANNYVNCVLANKFNASIKNSTNPTFSYNNVYYLPYNIVKNPKVVEGSTDILEDEVIITTKVADKLIGLYQNYLKLDYKSLIGEKITDASSVSIADKASMYLYFNNFTIKGIIDDKSTSVYLNNNTYMMNYCNSYNYVISLEKDLANTKYFYTDFGKNSYCYIGKGYEKNYKIIMGNDLSYNDNEKECLLCLDCISDYHIGEKVNDYTVVGFYNSDVIKKAILVNQHAHTKNEILSLIPFNSNIQLKEGRKPVNENEIVVSEYFNAELNSFFGEFTIVGKSVDKYANDYYGYVSNKLILKDNVSNYIYNDLFIVTDNPTELKQLFSDNGFTILKTYDSIERNSRKEKVSNLTSFLVLTGMLALVIIIFVFFMMRTKMLNKIYTIGVLRSIGASKFRIYRMFLIELILITTFTTLVGYILSMVLFSGINEAIKSFYSIAVSNVLMISGGVLLYVINIVFGLLPIWFLLRKTPSEIVAKYDI